MVYEMCEVWSELNSDIFLTNCFMYTLYIILIESKLSHHVQTFYFRHWKIKLVVSVASIQTSTIYMDKVKWWLEFHNVDKANFLFIKME